VIWGQQVSAETDVQGPQRKSYESTVSRRPKDFVARKGEGKTIEKKIDIAEQRKACLD